MSKKHIIKNSYDAYWFLHKHPKFMVEYRSDVLIGVKDLGLRSDNRYVAFEKADGTKLYQERFDRVFHHSIQENFDIHYTKVDDSRVVNKGKSLNKNVECWLEFGPMEWTTAECWEQGCREKPCLQHIHDIRLDCGAATFDQALIILARLAKKYYGDYEDKD